ncbi:putative alpha crystallin/Hsp20 domain, HSP20-like chaperone [Helianthus annuus]|nr:putative alpha crystallin/Hsp20 domain, HSP20-like chaperone [Helianthus annuus]KAJ0709090.1 putative alpha crystallin/Hsp20 domain, HSP20-like chaperone [Helianthus annuus]KAJ0712971.1 putative alpha crystallin/Hsp20 domain, HSP20-like chaperone [Helianthus annuus]KAJ0890218.1 putative alpha crystallin/Hsp20 domain, HSP20-like chaperone [Helianthus annuus]KAJ0894985.1 putative alpha crystallin/Hsp20 domain, HSP20-like chaperone [Helianthus annuus]
MAQISGKSPFDNKPSLGSLVFEEFVPPSAWTDDSTCLLVDLPGFKRQELKLQVDNQTHLVVNGERQVRENKYKRFEQRFELPKNVDTEKITGELDGEILFISVPKKVEHKHQDIKHDNIPAPVSDNIYSEESNKNKQPDAADVNEDETDNKDGKRNKHRMCFDENRGQKTDLFLRLAMQKLKNNKGIVATAIFAFSLGVLVTQKFRSNGN